MDQYIGVSSRSGSSSSISDARSAYNHCPNGELLEERLITCILLCVAALTDTMIYFTGNETPSVIGLLKK
jgi:hypothetical protein